MLVSRFRSSHLCAAHSLANFGIKGTPAIYDSSAVFGFEVPAQVRGYNDRNFKSTALKRVPFNWMQDGCDTHGVLPSPLWGGVGGGGSNWRMQLCAITTNPPPSPPPQGGREQTAVAARAESISMASALAVEISIRDNEID